MMLVTIDVESSVEHVNLNVGDELRLRITENATTGYIWRQAAALPHGVVMLGDEILPGIGGTGAAGKHEFRYSCTVPISTRLRFELARPWQIRQPIKTTSVEINCRR
jgi:predicted secreted protein